MRKSFYARWCTLEPKLILSLFWGEGCEKLVWKGKVWVNALRMQVHTVKRVALQIQFLPKTEWYVRWGVMMGTDSKFRITSDVASNPTWIGNNLIVWKRPVSHFNHGGKEYHISLSNTCSSKTLSFHQITSDSAGTQLSKCRCFFSGHREF